MQLKLKTILNFKEKHDKFVYRDIKFTGERIEICVEARKRSKALCSGCGKPSPGYDRLPRREFIHVPIWGIAVIFLYCMRRVSCADCGISVESVPWSSGKSPLTNGYAWFLSEWAKLLSLQEVARQCTSTNRPTFSN